ncbi:MAG TPA: hypothetical protein VGH38_26625 [Bryobacteraceae bacterium]|jgi:hypothetical protein
MSKVSGLQLLFLASIAVAQQVPDKPLQVVTVCEVLGRYESFVDTVVAVVGRMEPSVSPIHQYDFLSQDRCGHPVITHRHTWSNKIQIWVEWEEGMPKPPSDRPTFDKAVLAAKLSVVRKTTRLGHYQEQQFNADRYPNTTARVPNAWAVVYGRIVRSHRLNEDCGAEGCGGDDVPLVLIAEPSQVRTLSGDGKPLPKEE